MVDTNLSDYTSLIPLSLSPSLSFALQLKKVQCYDNLARVAVPDNLSLETREGASCAIKWASRAMDAVEGSKWNFYVVLKAIKILGGLGAAEYILGLWNGMEVKQLQVLTAGHFLIPHLYNLGLFKELKSLRSDQVGVAKDVRNRLGSGAEDSLKEGNFTSAVDSMTWWERRWARGVRR